MEQAILKDGRKMRFTGGIPKEYKPLIEQVIDIPEGEIHKVPELKDKELTLRDKTQEELDAEQVIIDEAKTKADEEKLIQDKTREQAMDALKKEGKL